MFICQLCRFEMYLDDVALRRGDDGCICLGCFSRETDSARPMPKALRRHLSAALATLDTPAAKSTASDYP